MQVIIANAFSLQMVGESALISVSPATQGEITSACEGGFLSAVGHADTAAVISERLGFIVPANRINVALHPGDVLFVGQLTGGRLPEGCTSLPEGFSLAFRKVELLPAQII